VEIIHAQSAHIPAIIELWKEFMDYHMAIDPLFTRSDEGGKRFGNLIAELLDSDKVLVLTAIDERTVVGYAIAEVAMRPPVFRERRYGIISDMAVRSSYRRRGIGKQMLMEIYEWFHSKSIQRIELRVVTENEIGYSFWKKHGFMEYMHVLYLERKDTP
jgi:GNAT superfamily N-acetyltransferase